MRILIAEYAVGGGVKSSSLLEEGQAMRSTLQESFEQAGYEVLSPVAEPDFEAAVARLSRECDAGMVIAPDEQLAGLTRVLESNTVNLGSPSAAVARCADKLTTTELLRADGILVPRIYSRAELSSELENDAEQQYVRKPRFGCASDDVFVVRKSALAELPSAPDREVIITEFISGTDISSSSIVGRSAVLPLTINKQFIRRDGTRLRYAGGVVPYAIARETANEVMHISARVARLLGCEGYVGIDFVLDSANRAYVVDVNPRPTTSLVGIARILNYNIADLLVRAKLGTLPSAAEIRTEGRYVFTLS
jgi:predicted ATP-grasp superfamily ATP-dependent carboligase